MLRRPSASIDRPITMVSAPQTTKSMPMRSMWRGTGKLTLLGRRSSDRDAHFDADRRSEGCFQTKAKASAVWHPRRARTAGPGAGLRRRRFLDTVAQGSCQVSPRPPHSVHVPCSGTSSGRTVPRAASRTDSRHFRLQGVRCHHLAKKDVALAFDKRTDRRKVDRDFVGKALVVRLNGADRVPDDRQRLLMKAIATHG